MIFFTKKELKRLWLISTGLVLLFASGCHKDPTNPEKTHETGTVTDIEGNIYKTVKIGDQWWMAENLKVTKYCDGSLMKKIQNDKAEWNNDNIGGYCMYDNNSKAQGLLYNVCAVIKD